MISTLYKIAKCTALSIRDLVNHDGVEHAGYLSFLFMLAIFPSLVFFMAITSFIGSEYITNILIEIILQSDWAKFIDALKPRILEISNSPPQGLLTIAIVGAIWTASSIFEGMRTVVNRANRISSPPPYLLRRLFSIIEFFSAIFIIMSLIIITVFIPAFIKFLDEFAPIHKLIFEYVSPDLFKLRLVPLMLSVFIVVAFTYKTLPNKTVKFKSVIPGAMIVIFAWSLFSKIFTIYLTNFTQVNLIYGSVTGIIISLMYFYACSIIYIFGAEFNHHISSNFSFLRK